jgi:peptidoglycan/LPS O-acetylase OafA/YrhL
VLVLLWHYVRCAVPPQDARLEWLTRPLALTWSGVDLFFVLSGYLIGGILFDHRESSRYFATFYVRRACRILPLYVLTLALFVAARAWLSPLLSPTLEPAMPLWSYVFFVQNLFMAWRDTMGAGWLGVTWSLAIEEQFYLLLPLVVRFLRPGTVAFAALMSCVVCPLVRILANVHLGWTAAFVLLPARADSLMAGVLVAWLMRRDGVREALARHVPRLQVLFWTLAAGTVYMSYYTEVLGPFDHSWLTLVYSLLLVLALVDGGVLRRLLTVRWLRSLGLWSYGIYVFHLAVSGLVHRLLLHQEPRLLTSADAWAVAAATALTVALAAASYALMERPILRYGHSFRY